MSALVVCVGCLVYANKCHPSLNTTNWQQQAPALIATATISALTGIIRFSKKKKLSRKKNDRFEIYVQLLSSNMASVEVLHTPNDAHLHHGVYINCEPL